MILRITRATVRRDMESAAFGILREAVAQTGRPDGLEAVFIGRRAAGSDVELVALTVWRDFEVIRRVLGPGWEQPSFFPALDPMLSDPSLEHYETVAEGYEQLVGLGLDGAG